jgi:ADP-ribosylglycohydrolase
MFLSTWSRIITGDHKSGIKDFPMIGAIAGDMIGSIFEHHPQKSINFPLFNSYSRFTDDTVMMLAVARGLMKGRKYGTEMKDLGRKYPDAGYGGTFINWLFEDEIKPYQSWGNGSAMRVSPIGFYFDTESEVLQEAKASAEVSHDHPEGIKGAQAVALSILLARMGEGKEEIRRRIKSDFSYDLDRTIEDIRPGYRFDVSCQGSVPEAIIAFLDSSDYESAVRLAVSLGGDADTQACIAGGIAEAFYGGVPAAIQREVRGRLPDDLLGILEDFENKPTR